MAGRGCTVTISILGGSTGNGQNEDLSLPVALHSPLSVLKEQLAVLTNIAIEAQVIILCDLSDAERNNDVLLEGRDYMSLRECGIRNGSFLTLHALGMSAERQQALKAKVGAASDPEEEEQQKEQIHSLDTRITAAQANHSYNGVIFDVHCKGPFEVDLISVSIGGMLGHVRIYARDRPWEADKSNNPSSHWWAHRESVSREGWKLVADINCRPSWDKPYEIKFNEPIRLLPHQRRALYCHSGLPDDLGIQYQSYSKDSIVAQDDHIVLLPGLGHTGNEPFDDEHGWYRAWRGLSGSVSYRARRKGWSPFEHSLFPVDMKDAVKTLLLCQNRICTVGNGDDLSPRMLVAEMSANEEEISAPGGAEAGAEAGAGAWSSGSAELLQDSCTKGGYQQQQQELFHVLPKHVVYNIMEYMHWDWFEEVGRAAAAAKDEREEEDSDEDAPRGRTAFSGLQGLVHAFTGGSTDGAGGGASTADILAQLMAMHTGGDYDNYYMQDDSDEEDDDDDSGDDDQDDEVEAEEDGGYGAGDVDDAGMDDEEEDSDDEGAGGDDDEEDDSSLPDSAVDMHIEELD